MGGVKTGESCFTDASQKETKWNFSLKNHGQVRK